MRNVLPPPQVLRYNEVTAFIGLFLLFPVFLVFDGDDESFGIFPTSGANRHEIAAMKQFD